MSVDVIGQDPAAFDSDDPICHGSNGLIVRNDDDRGMTLAAQIMEKLQNGLAGHVIQSAGRLVTEKKLRILGKRSCNGNALLFPAGELCREIAGAL